MKDSIFLFSFTLFSVKISHARNQAETLMAKINNSKKNKQR